jgi:hypothetical protein
MQSCCALSLVFIDSTNCFGSILPHSSCPNITRSSGDGGNRLDSCDGLVMIIPVNEVDTALFISIILFDLYQHRQRYTLYPKSLSA